MGKAGGTESESGKSGGKREGQEGKGAGGREKSLGDIS